MDAVKGCIFAICGLVAAGGFVWLMQMRHDKKERAVERVLDETIRENAVLRVALLASRSPENALHEKALQKLCSDVPETMSPKIFVNDSILLLLLLKNDYIADRTLGISQLSSAKAITRSSWLAGEPLQPVQMRLQSVEAPRWRSFRTASRLCRKKCGVNIEGLSA